MFCILPEDSLHRPPWAAPAPLRLPPRRPPLPLWNRPAGTTPRPAAGQRAFSPFKHDKM